MKYSMPAIPVEVLALAFIEFVFVSTYAAVLWYMSSGQVTVWYSSGRIDLGQ